MEILDNVNHLWGEDLKKSITSGSKLKIAAFTTTEATDKIKKEKREFHIPKEQREKDLYGSEFKIQLKNKLTQKAIAKECASWMRRKAKFRSNSSKAPMQQFAYLESRDQESAYMPIHGFTAVDLGYQKGNAVSNFINKIDGIPLSSTYLHLFDQIWNDKSKLENVTDKLCEHIESVYKENSPQKIYYLMLFHIFNEFLEDINEDVLPNDLTGYHLVVIDESHNFRNNDAYKDKETRYKKLMNSVIRNGVKTKVLMLSATPVNNHFNDLRNQLALAYEGDSEKLSKNLRTSKSIEKIFIQAQTVFNQWSKLPSEERTAKAILNSLDFDFFELLDSVTIARSRKHIEQFYDTQFN